MAENLLQGLQAAANATSQAGVGKKMDWNKMLSIEILPNTVCFERKHFENPNPFRELTRSLT